LPYIDYSGGDQELSVSYGKVSSFDAKELVTDPNSSALTFSFFQKQETCSTAYADTLIPDFMTEADGKLTITPLISTAQGIYYIKYQAANAEGLTSISP
jgi:hypothetical protein